MHIPDFVFGYAPWGIPVGIVFCVIALLLVFLATRWAVKNLNKSKVVILSVIAAGIFALQAFNLPTGFGVSGHLVGGALAAIVLGSPFAAVFVLAIILIIQALVFGDGGVLALGANIINMGFIGGTIGFYTYKLLKNKIPTGLSAGFAGWFACVVAACACALEIAILGAVPITVGLPAMFIYHAIIGLVEGILTCIVVMLIFKVRPELSDEEAEPEKQASLGKIAAIGIILALVIGGCAVFFASANPDGLDSTILINEGQKELFADATGDEVAGEENDPIQWNAPMPDYALNVGGEDSPVGGVVALLIGIIVVLGLIFGAATLARRAGGKQE